MKCVNTPNNFGLLFKKFRLKSEIETLTLLGEFLAYEGIIYENSIFTKWQKGDRIPRDRVVLIKLLKIFKNRKGLKNLNDANLFCESAGQGYLTDIEQKTLGFSR